MQHKKGVSLYSAAGLAIASMVRSGVFTSLGFQLVSHPSAFSILMLWLLGGIIALCGACSYGDLSCRMPGQGGEYHFITRIYGRSIGFMSGWISVVAAFTAPIAASAVATSRFTTTFLGIDKSNVPLVATIIIFAFTFLNLGKLTHLLKIQNFFVVLKILLIVFFGLAAFALTKVPTPHVWLPSSTKEFTGIFNSDFAISLVFVGYAFSGWNAATYIAQEVDDVQKNLRSLLPVSQLLRMS